MARIGHLIRQDTPEAIIDKWYQENYKPRVHLGLSQCGHECDRWLWYCHRGKQVEGVAPEGRVLRLFGLGNLLENQVIIDLQTVGYQITDQQKTVEFTFRDTVIRGHIDGIITGLKASSKPHLLEIKTANDKQFNALKKAGYEKWNEKYKFQVHAYMFGLELDCALAVVINKNTSELRTERIKLDRNYILDRLERLFMAIGSEHPPERLCPRMDYYKAKWCDLRNICWNENTHRRTNGTSSF